MEYIKLYESFDNEYKMTKKSEDFIRLREIIEDSFIDTDVKFQFEIDESFNMNSIGEQISESRDIIVDISSNYIRNSTVYISEGNADSDKEISTDDIIEKLAIRNKHISEFNSQLTSLLNRLVKSGYLITHFNGKYYECSFNILIKNEKVFIK